MKARLVLPATVAAALLLPATSACSGQENERPAVTVPAASSPTPENLTPESAVQAFKAYVTNDDVARTSGDERLALSWASDGQAQLIAAEFRKAAFTGDPVPRYHYGTPTLYVPRLTSYPQWFVSVVERSDVTEEGKTEAPRTAVMAFIRRSAADRWRLSLSTLPDKGTKLPKVTVGPDGYATPLATFDDGLLIKPRSVAAIHTTLAEEGSGSQAANVMKTGPYTSGLYTANRKAGKDAKEAGLAYETVYTATDFPIFPLRTDDGGGLVLYALSRDTVIYVRNPDDGGLAIPREAAHLLDTIVLKNQLGMVETLQFAATDPATPKGKDKGKKDEPKAEVIAKDGAVTKANAR